MGDILGLGWKGQLVVKFDQLLGAAHAKHWSKYFNSLRALHFYGIIREVGLLCNNWYSGCNLMRDNPLTRSEIPDLQHTYIHLITIQMHENQINKTT